MFKKQKWVYLIIFTGVFALGFFANFYFDKFSYKMKNDRNCNNIDYKYINPALICVEKAVVNKRNYVEFKTKLYAVIQEKIDKKEISSASVYFRDLEYGPTFGINEYAQYAPASLLKVPLMLTYLNLQKQLPDLDKVKLYYEPQRYTHVLDPIFPPSQSIKENTPYSIDELLSFMIVNSDNKAYFLLLDYLEDLSPSEDLLKETYIDLGLIDPKSDLENTITIRSYAAIFTQLYYASFLEDKDASEKALTLLNKTEFKDGIIKGLPNGIKTANKFGERSGFDGDLKQLHDCGIVYYPKNPYELCIMTQGTDVSKLSDTIALISKMVYEEFDSRKY